MNVGYGSFSSDLDVAGLGDHDGPHRRHPHASSPLASDKNLPTSPLALENDAKELPPQETPSKLALFKRIFLTLALYLCYIGIGLNSGIIGPTLVHLEHLFHTDTAGISKSFVGSNCAYLLGTLLCAVLFDRINHEIQFAFWGTMLGICCMTVPWMPGLYYYYGITALMFVAQGVAYSGGQSYVIRLWAGSGKKEPTLLAMYMCWSIGALVAPFICMPFLDELDHLNEMNQNNTFNHSSAWHTNEFTGATVNSTVNEGSKLFTSVHKVKYIFAIVGLINIFAALLFFIGFLIKGPTCKSSVVKPTQNQHMNDKSTKSACNTDDKGYLMQMKLCKGTIVFLVWLFAVMYFWHEYTIGTYISAFCFKGLNWPVDQSALATSIFFGLLGAGRIIGIGISKLLSPTKMIVINISITTLGLSLLLFSQKSSIIVWVAVAMAGYGMSTTSPSYVLWTSNYMTISGAIGAMFMAGSATGSMTVGGLVGYLFQEFTHMWVVYISLGSSIANILIFLALTLVGRYLKSLEKAFEAKNMNSFVTTDAPEKNPFI